MLTYKVKKIEDKTFWDVLNALPNLPPGQKEFPVVLTLGSTTFLYAPVKTMESYKEVDKPDRGLHFDVPYAPTAYTSVGYLFGKQVGNTPRRVFAVFTYGEGLAMLAEVGVFPLLHRPRGLRMPGGEINRAYQFSDVVIKGDDAPIHMVMQSPNNPNVGMSVKEMQEGEGDKATFYLQIEIQAPGLVTMNLNHTPTL